VPLFLKRKIAIEPQAQYGGTSVFLLGACGDTGPVEQASLAPHDRTLLSV
jgi:hypothetical protein